MTKSDQIKALLTEGVAPRQIAADVGCHPGYVTAVKHRATGRRPADVAYFARTQQARRDPVVAPKSWAAARAAYAVARRAGLSRKQAHARACAAADTILRQHVTANRGNA